MKKFALILLYFGLALTVFSCTSGTDEDPLNVFREIAYNSLTASEKSSLIGAWQNAEVSAWVDGNYLVTFKTTEDATLGPIQVVVDPGRGIVIEKLPRF
ncbi:hypothetical protein [Algoriphagus mannitolivorans]|uniref:hypothetical protein n=1 Tax=Algoriphagus mannitolivorans TaxID=226504 RepID=UPI0003FDD986|nr:hypothetical protein [Algoriphagus mannitolivorans]